METDIWLYVPLLLSPNCPCPKLGSAACPDQKRHTVHVGFVTSEAWATTLQFPPSIHQSLFLVLILFRFGRIFCLSFPSQLVTDDACVPAFFELHPFNCTTLSPFFG
jgi:hypothetical protein